MREKRCTDEATGIARGETHSRVESDSVGRPSPLHNLSF